MAARPRGLRPTRRALLSGAGLAVLLGGCGHQPPASPAAPGARRVRYGPGPSQYADLRRPPRARSADLTVVLLHGGYWLPPYTLDLMQPLARRLTALGCVTWNLEYRRTGAGGGWPDTFTDVADGIDALAEQDVPRRTVLLGHSAGGHLAVWAASRTERTPGGPARAQPERVVSLAGVLDLTTAASQPGSSGPVTALMGGTPVEVPQRYALADPTLLVPAACPVWAVRAEDDQVVAPQQAPSYVAAATARGGTATLLDVPGDHATLIDPASEAFPAIADLVLRGSTTSRTHAPSSPLGSPGE